MHKVLNRFRADESGAVTVDWVVLTTALVALAAASYNTISAATNGVAGDTRTTMENMSQGSFNPNGS